MSFPDAQAERRRTPRFALQLPAWMREPAGSRVPVRVIDISTRGCRIEHVAGHSLPPNVWLYLASLDARYARVVWYRDTFAGLEFEAPLHEAVLDNLLKDRCNETGPTVEELRDIARRSRSSAVRAGGAPISKELKELSRDCAISALTQRLKDSADKNRS